MDDWFRAIASDAELPSDLAQQVRDVGFAIIPGPVERANVARLAAAYDAVVANAEPTEISVGRSTIRVQDLINRGPDFDSLYTYRPILAACCQIIDRPFKLSTMHARTVNPHAPAQALHVDFQPDPTGWTMVGFIFMVDAFGDDNGATRLVPGSHRWPAVPGDVMRDPTEDHPHQVLACGTAGSVIVYNGSVWHGHSANPSSSPRRSIQGAYIRRDAKSAVDQASRIRRETLARIDPLAKYVLAV